MSVIARSPDGTIRLYCKGSDAKVMKKVRGDTPEELIENTNANLHYFAKQVCAVRGGVECGALACQQGSGAVTAGLPPIQARIPPAALPPGPDPPACRLQSRAPPRARACARW